jgi:gliding motility-associated-like protein
MGDYQMQIFNRWGNLVWETDNPTEGWDGRYKASKDVQLGLYTWKIQYTDNKLVTRTLVGHVNVLR